MIKMKYIPALDGVRAIAIILVLVFHWFPEGVGLNALPNGPIGVTMFFVLSGYLISNILMQAQTRGTFWKSFKNFVVRRALRIFPIYFLVLAILLMLRRWGITVVTDFYEHPGYYWTYFYNHWLEKNQNWSDMLSPYWSLSVEEQFYVVWPIFILLIRPGKGLITFLWGTIFVGMLARYFLVYRSHGVGVYMITCVDTFAWGALLAYYMRSGQELIVGKWIKRLIIPVGLAFLMVCLFHTDEDLVKQIFFRTLASMLSFALIFSALNHRNFVSNFLNFRPLRAIGKVSYGIYLYHMLAADLFFQVANRLHIGLPSDLYYVVGPLILLVVSFVSYYVIEKPIQTLKRYFE